MSKIVISFGGAIFLGWILLGAGCSFDKPMNPSWDMQLVIPLSEQRYSLIDLVDTTLTYDTTGVGIRFTAGDSLLYFCYRDTIPYTRLGDSLYLPPQHFTFEAGVRNIYFDAGINQDLHYGFGEVYPPIIPYLGQRYPVPPFNFIPVTKDFDPFNNLDSVVVDSGYLHITVTNNLPVAIDRLTLTFFHTLNPGYAIEVPLADTLLPDSTVSDSVDLHGMLVVHNFSLTLSGSSLGSAPDSVLVEASDNISVHGEVGRVRISQAMGKIPEQTFSLDSMYAIESNHIIREARIQRGTIYLHNINETEMRTTLKLRFYDLTSPQGDMLETQTILEPQHTSDDTISIGGYTLRLPNIADQMLHVYAEAHVDSSAEWVHYYSDQVVFSATETDTLYLDYLDGILSPINAVIEPVEREVEQVPEGWEQFNFVGSNLLLRLNSNRPTPISTNLRLVAWREGIPRDSILIQETITPNQDTTLVLDGLEKLLNDRPDVFTLYGTAGISGDLLVESSDFVQGNLQVNVPFSFTASPITINGDIQETDRAIDSDKKVKGATVETTIHNHLPLSGNIVVLVSHDLSLFSTNPLLLDTLVNFTIEPPTISGGRVVGEVESQIDIALTDEQIGWFRTVPVYVRPIYHLDGTGGDTLSAYGSDYLGFSAIGRFIYEVDTE